MIVTGSCPASSSALAPCVVSDGGRFVVYGTGEQSRDVTYVDDAVLATLAAMDAAAPRSIFNVGGGSETSLSEIIDLCRALSGRDLEVEHRDAAAGDVRRTAADTSRILAELGWRPQTELEQGLTAHLSWAASPVRAQRV